MNKASNNQYSILMLTENNSPKAPGLDYEAFRSFIHPEVSNRQVKVVKGASASFSGGLAYGFDVECFSVSCEYGDLNLEGIIGTELNDPLFFVIASDKLGFNDNHPYCEALRASYGIIMQVQGEQLHCHHNKRNGTWIMAFTAKSLTALFPDWETPNTVSFEDLPSLKLTACEAAA